MLTCCAVTAQITNVTDRNANRSYRRRRMILPIGAAQSQQNQELELPAWLTTALMPSSQEFVNQDDDFCRRA